MEDLGIDGFVGGVHGEAGGTAAVGYGGCVAHALGVHEGDECVGRCLCETELVGKCGCHRVWEGFGRDVWLWVKDWVCVD